MHLSLCTSPNQHTSPRLPPHLSIKSHQSRPTMRQHPNPHTSRSHPHHPTNPLRRPTSPSHQSRPTPLDPNLLAAPPRGSLPGTSTAHQQSRNQSMCRHPSLTTSL